MVPNRIVDENTLWERTGCGWRRGHTEVGNHFSGTKIPVLAPGYQHNTAQCTSRLRSWHGLQGRTRPPKTPKGFGPISRKVWKKGLCMITNLHRKQEIYLQGGKTYLLNATKPGSMCIPRPWTLD